MTTAGKGELDTLVKEAFGMRASTCAHLIEQCDGSFLEKAGADAPEHVIRALPLKNEVIDAGGMQQLPEQQSCRPGPDDCDFCPQYALLPIL